MASLWRGSTRNEGTLDDYPIDVGAMLFTMVDPNKGHEVAYNRWYERDHFYGGCMIGPGILSGARWVATKPLKDLRFPESSPFAEPVTAGSYLAIYWLNKGQEAEWGAWGSQQVWWLYDNGRGFDERTHAQTGMYNFASTRGADDHQVPVALALDHRYESLLVVVVEPATGVTSVDIDAGPVTQLLASGAAALASSWTLQQRPPSPDSTGESDGEEQTSPMPLGASGGAVDRIVQLIFSEQAPTDAWPGVVAYAADIEAAGLGTVTFASPFLPTDVGTDRYTDELW